MGFFERAGDAIKHGWNAFTDRDETTRARYTGDYGPQYGLRPDRGRLNVSNERSILASALTRISIDVAAVVLKHIKQDENERYTETVKSGLNECLTVEANLDQAARAFRQDMAMTLMDKGVIATVPVETTLNPIETGGYDIKTMRVGHIVAWYPQHVGVSLYNEKVGRREEIIIPKRITAITENPLYAIMNEPNSTFQRLQRKLNILDAIDEQSGSGKLDMVIQLPYTVKSEVKRDQAEERRKALEVQLKNSKYGIGYIDATEKITQLNRPVENNLFKQVEYLTGQLYGQLGLSEEVFNGTADEAAMLNYQNRTVEPIVAAIVEAMRRTFLSKTARTQGQTIAYFTDPFKLIPMSEIAEIADKLTRNEILSANEIRALLGFKPSKDPKADALVNSNMPQPVEGGSAPAVDTTEQDAAIDGVFNNLESNITSMLEAAGG